jgi:hypothetical protein
VTLQANLSAEGKGEKQGVAAFVAAADGTVAAPLYEAEKGVIYRLRVLRNGSSPLRRKIADFSPSLGDEERQRLAEVACAALNAAA